jgi:DNA-binding transcriptional LysR family regulator
VIKALLKTTSRLLFRSGLAHDQAEGLLNRSLDVIITGDAMDELDGLERYPILSEPYLLLLPSNMQLGASEIDLRQLATSYSLIRFSARSHVGAQIERHLRRLSVKAPHLLEVDASDALVSMVGAGLGWGIATPLCLLQVHSRLEGVKALPFPGPSFVRQLHLITRSGEYGELPGNVAEIACTVLRDHCVPEMRRLIPWLRNQVVVG